MYLKIASFDIPLYAKCGKYSAQFVIARAE